VVPQGRRRYSLYFWAGIDADEGEVSGVDIREVMAPLRWVRAPPGSGRC
jgi:hypothetical protein